MTKCACGKPLHYRNSELKRIIEELSSRLGQEVEVCIGDRRFMVQRHYIALHGLNGPDVESLADQGIIRRI